MFQNFSKNYISVYVAVQKVVKIKNMKQNETIKFQKSSKIYECESCDYKTSRKSQYERHITTDKHKKRTNETFETEMKQNSSEKFQCLCGNVFYSRTTLWRHKKNCKENIHQ